MAICSGVIVLFFIQAFDTNQTFLELLMRWFIGTIVATINYVYSEPFYSKWKESIHQKEMAIQLSELEKKYTDQTNVLKEATTQLIHSKSEIDRLMTYVADLEAFKKREVDKLTCQCGSVFESIYKLTSHKGSCRLKQTNGQKQPGYNGVVTA